jgi:hypothetical protein
MMSEFNVRNENMKTKKTIKVSLVAALLLFGVAMLFVDTIPPRSMTHLSMHMCKRRVLRYAQEHGVMPSSLSDTKPIEGYHSSIKDGWGVVLTYRVEANDVVTFKSLGKDRTVGGAGDDIDMIGIFPAKTSDGSWSDEFVEWTQDPFDEIRKE